MIVGLLFVAFVILMLLGIPIGISIGLASVLTLVYENEVPLAVIPQKMFMAVNSFTMLAIPFFMLAGGIMDRSGITQRLVEFSNAIVGWMKGGMCHVSVVTGMLMGGISGSAPADTAALSSVMIPSMSRMGYPKSFAAALQASAGSIGIIIPPSIPMVVLGGITGVSVGSLFLGGIVPGIGIGIALMLTARYICIKKNIGEGKTVAFSLSAAFRALYRALLPLTAPVIIIGGILTGVFTPTESSVVAVVFTLGVGIFIYRTVTLRMLPDIFSDAAVSAANVMLIIASSSLFSWILTRNDFPDTLRGLLGGGAASPAVILLVVNFIFFIGGMFIEGLALIIMFVPIFLPIVEEAGINPLVFCIMLVINIAIGTLTPPVGVCLFVASSSAGVKLEDSARSVLPFVGAMLVCLALTGVFPALVTFVPGLAR